MRHSSAPSWQGARDQVLVYAKSFKGQRELTLDITSTFIDGSSFHLATEFDPNHPKHPADLVLGELLFQVASGAKNPQDRDTIRRAAQALDVLRGRDVAQDRIGDELVLALKQAEDAIARRFLNS
ncbi:hypothetical protein [Microvirga tunisiensis]|uniref:Uncharacterized protein n=1 Tax=Microvirga tunisiensis TaxID=2108360 RepID=A0A5N7MAP0_9HYPH|nr:hypothetical protein [Microvirga tunisiensis]MPR05617.1 hypothetical protein [Microvirga tunisiensis]MPR23817.1 hypothetical protein [Microvirga tunisiensis]